MKVIFPGDRSAFIYVGPWLARLQWDRRSYGFGIRESDGPLTRFVRRWWTGWHRWADEA